MWIVLQWVACSGTEDGPVGGVAPTVGPLDCDPVDPAICALPWPSSTFQVEADTPSGVLNAFPQGALPENRDAVPLDVTMWNEFDGFPVLGPMLVYVGGDVDPASLVGHERLEASDGSGSSLLLDVGSGLAVPHFTEGDATAPDDATRVLVAHPVAPLRHGTRHVFALRGLTRTDGSPIEPSDAFRALRDATPTDDPDVEARRAWYEDVVFSALESFGWRRDELLVAWDWVTVSQEHSLARPLALRDDLLADLPPEGPPYTIDSVEDVDCAYPGTAIGRTLQGTMTLPLYTDIDGPNAILTRDADGLPFRNGDTAVPFLVRVPCSVLLDPSEGARVVQYGHGLFGDRFEAETGWLSEAANTHRWVVFAQDWTGMSTEDSGLVTLMLATDVSGFRTVPERSMQGFGEVLAGTRLALGALPDDPALQVDGQSVIDRAKGVQYYGNSQGGILGGAIMRLSTDLTRGVLGVPGMPYPLLLPRSADFDPFFRLLKEKYTDHRDIAVVEAALGAAWAPGEPGGYAFPLPGEPPKAVLLHPAIGDAQVTTLGAHVMARAWGAVSVAPAARPVWGVAEATPPFTGSAMVEWSYSDVPAEPVESLPAASETDTHECPRREPTGQAQIEAFFATGVVEAPCDGVCVGLRAERCP
jgi:hypothetical protein